MHAALEADLAELKGMETSLLFPTGYQANMAVLSALGTSDSVIFSDALNHASIIDGCRLSKARVEVYAHRDMTDLERRIEQALEKRRIVVTDEIFSMDGVGAPMVELKALKERYNLILVTDSAHSTLVYGENGGGLSEKAGVFGVADFAIGTLSKAIGCQGGFVACSHTGREWLLNHGRAFIFTTALALPLVAGARAAIEVARTGELRSRLWSNADRLADALERPVLSPILPVILGEEERALSASAALLAAGIHVPAIRPPTVPAGACRLRVALSAGHTEEDIALLGRLLRPWCLSANIILNHSSLLLHCRILCFPSHRSTDRGRTVLRGVYEEEGFGGRNHATSLALPSSGWYPRVTKSPNPMTMSSSSSCLMGVYLTAYDHGRPGDGRCRHG